LLGQPKEKESLASFLSASNILSLKLGRVDVRFHKPWSLREFITDQTVRIRGAPSIQNSYDINLKRKLLSVLGYQVLADINAASVVMPTALIGTVLLTLRGRGVGKAELVRRVDWICEKVKSRGGRVSHFGGQSTSTVVDRGLEVLGPKLVGKEEGLAEPTFYAVDRFQLSFYRNMTIHLFVSEALVCAALYTKVKQGGGAREQTMSYKDMQDYVFFLSQVFSTVYAYMMMVLTSSQLFRAEFIFSSTPLAENLNNTLLALERDGILHLTRSPSNNSTESISEIRLSDAERSSGRENFDFYCFLIWPFIEAAWLGAISLLMLAPPPLASLTVSAPVTAPRTIDKKGADVKEGEWLDLNKVQSAAQLLGKTLYHQGDLSYFEAVNKESLQKGYTRVEEEGMLIIQRSKDSKVKPRVKLGEQWLPKRDLEGMLVLEGCRLWEFADQISISRREGKNRRDGMTVRGRVVNLVELVGKQLWAEARVGRVGGEVVEEEKRSGRRKLKTNAKL